MALINCPECGSQVSDSAGACPNCGHPMRGNKPSKSKASTLKTGAIVNVIGGLGWLLMFAYIGMRPSTDSTESKSSGSGGFDLTVSVSSDSIIHVDDLTRILMFASIILITVISIVILFIKRPARKPMLAACSVLLALAVISLISVFTMFGTLAFVCGLWLMFWGTYLQVIGSIICMSGALKLDD
jgi:hypothetical protein